tara:strand:- start:335 stop:1129 length:795 start_codon:yes stop_codon:yes gene_type:complete
MYFDEDMLLDIRLNILKDEVDKFVIAEATKTHSGEKKNLNFDINKFLKFKDKIEYLVIDNLPTEVNNFKKDWAASHIRDQFQRNCLQKGYKNCNDNDLIMISDLDEIPDPKKIKEFDIKNKYACFIQKNLHQKMNLLNETIMEWPGTKICEKKYLKSPQWLRDIKTKKRPFWKFYKPEQPQIILNGGWHFNDLKKAKDLSKKFKSGAHQEENLDEFTNIEKISKRIEEKKDLLGRNYTYKTVKIDESYPDYIAKNKNKYKEWIL